MVKIGLNQTTSDSIELSVNLTIFALAIPLALVATSSHAIEERLVHSPTGTAVFKVRFFDTGDGAFMPDWPEDLQSTWNLDAKQKGKIESSISYWAEIIKPEPGQLPAIINVGTFNQANASGTSTPLTDEDGGIAITQIQAALMGEDADELTFGSHAQFVMGKLDFDTIDYVPAQLPRPDGQADLVGVAFHELAHGLGVLDFAQDSDGPGTPRFADALGSWSRGLRDDNGNPSRPGQAILCSLCDNPYEADAFDVRKDEAHFTGKNISEVLAGALPGVPVKVLGHSPRGDSGIDDNYMSHSELKNSMMSHQTYRNYSTFMEAELAAMQDLGYNIDRRNFFGHSVYGNGQHLVNNNGFFQRNREGTAYLSGQYNTATLGLGLHVYGDHNTIFQQADLLSKGAGGAGIRVDGQANDITIPSGTRVHADGLNGRGVMFAYGKGHNLILRGDVQALGDMGIGASFDFGNNPLSNDTEYRGSYIHSSRGQALPLLDELNGALVESFDLTGRIAGKAQAIYMSRNALVKHINVMNGAQIEGDIRSDYAQADATGKARLSQLSFGQLADANGRATGQTDAGFRWRYDGNIKGLDNIVLAPMGGTTTLNGQHEVHGVNVGPAATLDGNGHYVLKSGSSFINNGTLSPGNSIGRIDIAGDYQQGGTGILRMDVNGAQEHDTLAVTGNAGLNGQLTLTPQPGDWYSQSWSLRSSDLVQAGSVDGAFKTLIVELSSPTLSVGTQRLDASSFEVRIGREENAYSQYATNDNAAAAGRALYQLASTSGTNTRPLLQSLDFSANDGTGVARALDQLTPAGYSAMVASSLNREQQIGGIVSGRATRYTPGALSPDQWTAFAVPFGGSTWQDTQGSMVGYDSSSYGVVFGTEKHSTNNTAWKFGAYGAVSGQSVDIGAPQNGSGKSTAFNLGLHARFAPNETAGPYAFSQAQLGIEDGRLTRHINVDGYSAKHSADWTGWSGSLAAGGGYRWALTDSVSVGPIVSFAYTHLSRPELTESGPAATGLTLDSSHFNSLRSSMGFNAGIDLPLKNRAGLRADFQITWDRELLNNDAIQYAYFAGAPEVGFASRNQVMGRDSLGLQAGLAFQVKENISLGANVSSQFFRAGQRSVAGNVSVNWRF
ncbi:autotransporter domain-containing protein [Pollutimonas subterranea]|uniref:Autotransporter domain-containing protein n=1 Tax=Pollutimonas subterranea TaxID=2045210 RepID=A0A2N4U661_9BURK|nr:autotransporter domain-containing protein [Pollutimonas subterranea]